ncbi:MAG: MBL fold metallo-hydrolase [Nanoarchaeota archaeon]
MDLKEGVKIDFLGHSGFLIRFMVCGIDGKNCVEKKLVIDPYGVSPAIKDVDYVFITHSHYDHCSIEDIKKIIKKGTVIVIPPDAQSKLAKLEGVEVHLVEPGDEFIANNNLKVDSVNAYNLGKVFHPKSEGWVGFVLKFGKVIVYHAGDTDNIPDMQKLSGYGKKENYFVTLLPVSGKYVMNAEEACEVASLLGPNLAIPMHYGAGVAGTHDDAKRFVELCKGKNINAVVLDKI